MNNVTGELAALGAALAFSFTSTFFTLAGRKFGAIVSLALSLPISCSLLVIIHQLTLHQPLPTLNDPVRLFDLSMSSLLGFVISSILLLRAFQYIGPRLSLLIGSVAPVLSAILAWIFLDQDLPANAVIGILLVIGGIIGVVSEGDNKTAGNLNTDFRKGILFALGAALGQGFAFVFSSRGVSGDYPAMSAAVIRTLVGAVTLWLLIASQGNLRRTFNLVRTEKPSMKFILGAAIMGPAIGASLVLIALQFTDVGIASTLTNTTPIMLIPISYFVFKERITFRAIIGTLVAIVGIAFLFT